MDCPRFVFLLFLLLVAPSGSPRPAWAHTRERNRIDALEVELAKKDAVVAAGLKSLSAEKDRLEQALEARREHGRRLEARLSDLEAALSRGLKNVETKSAAELEKERKVREALRQRIEGESQAFRAQIEALRASAREQALLVEEFRKGLKDFAGQVDLSFAADRKRLLGLEGRIESQGKDFARKLSDLLEVVGEENRKLRKAIDGVSRGHAEGGMHEVQPGESLYGIARSYGLSSEDLQKANPELVAKKGVIHPGDRLIIPGGAGR